MDKSDYKLPLALMVEEHRAIPPKTNWDLGVKCFPSHVRSLNEDIFKTTVQDLLKMSVDTNLQRNYVGDGLGDPAIAGFGLPRSALTDGSIAGAEVLFKRSLHDVHGLFESKCYLKNPQSAEVLAEHHQSALLESINCVTNGE